MKCPWKNNSVITLTLIQYSYLYFRGNQYDQFAEPIKKTDSTVVDNASTPESIPEIERPPLRKIDQYIRPELPYLSKRATVALLSCTGFIIMFGMRTSVNIVKVEMVSLTLAFHRFTPDVNYTDFQINPQKTFSNCGHKVLEYPETKFNATK